MNLTWQQYQVLVARCLYKFFLDGTLKAYGVIMEGTVNSFQAHHYLIGFAFSLQIGIGHLIAPFAGILSRRVHPRIVASIGGFLAGLGFIGRAFLPSMELWQLFACLTLSGVGFGLVNVITIISLKETFEPTYYTIVFSVTLLPSYIGIAMMPPLLEYLQREYGEHIGMCVFGVLSWSLMLSGLFTPSGKTVSKDEIEINLDDNEIFQTDQKGYGSTPGMQKLSYDADYEKVLNKTTDIEDCTDRSILLLNGSTTTDGGKTRTEMNGAGKHRESDETVFAWRGLKAWISIAKDHPEFLFLTVIIILLDDSYTSWSIFLVPYGEYLGLNSSTAVWLSTLGGIAGLFGRLCCIILFSVNGMNLSIGVLIPALCVTSAYVISLSYSSFHVLALVSCLSGFGLSVQGCTLPAWFPSCVCEYNFKTALYGSYALSGIMTLTGGITTGGIVDISGSYRVSFASLAILSFIQAIAVVFWICCPSLPSPEKSASSRKGKLTNCCTGS